MTTQSADYDHNLVVDQDTPSTSTRSSWLGRAWEVFVEALSRDSQPEVYQKCTSEGHCYWRVYNPATGYFADLESGVDVCWWLEQRH